MYLHDTNLIKKSAQSVLNEFMEKYEFQYEDKMTEILCISIIKNEVVIAICINNKQGYNLFILREGDEFHKRYGMMGLIGRIYPMFNEERKIYTSEVYQKAVTYGEYTQKYYESLILSDLEFIELHYPEVFQQGVPPNYD